MVPLYPPSGPATDTTFAIASYLYTLLNAYGYAPKLFKHLNSNRTPEESDVLKYIDHTCFILD